MLRPIPIPAIRQDDVPISREGPSYWPNDDAIDGFVIGVLTGHGDWDDKRRPALKNGHI